MKPFFSPEGEEALRAAVRDRTPIIFDFDGTLAPIVDDPAAAAMRGHTRSLLRALALLVPCAVVSGRARADVAPRLSGVPLRAIIGNHGAEGARSAPPPAVRARVLAWAAALRAGIDDPGVHVEEKGFSIAVHVRRAADPGKARERVVRLAAALPGARVFGGKLAVNVVPERAASKGDAVEAIASQLSGSAAVYVGDDETDEDAFRSPAVTWSVRVERADVSAARFFVDDQLHVDALLRAVIFEHARQGG